MQIDFLKLPSKVNPSLGEGRLVDFIFGTKVFILGRKYEINRKFKHSFLAPLDIFFLVEQVAMK